MSAAAFVILGQSNGGFYGDLAWCVSPSNCQFYNMYSRGFGPLNDPLPGFPTPPNFPYGGGSIWSRLGGLYRAQSNQPWQSLCFAPLDVNGSSSSQWVPGTPAYNTIAQARTDLVAAGYSIAGYIWMDGESDGIGPFPAGQYTQNVLALVNGLRSAGDQAPFFQCICTLCDFDTNSAPIDGGFQTLTAAERLRRANQRSQILNEQHWLASNPGNAPLKIVPGVNLDLVPHGLRHDGTHLNHQGQLYAAELFLDLLLRNKAAGTITV